VAGIRQGGFALGWGGRDGRGAGAADGVRGGPVGGVRVRVDPAGLSGAGGWEEGWWWKSRRTEEGRGREVVVLGYGAGDRGVVWGVHDFRAGVAGWEPEFGYGQLDVFVSDLGGFFVVHWAGLGWG